jgi:hypothetical protein
MPPRGDDEEFSRLMQEPLGAAPSVAGMDALRVAELMAEPLGAVPVVAVDADTETAR